MPPAVAGTQSADRGRRRRSTSHCAAPITPPATPPAIIAAPTDSIGPTSSVAAAPPIGKPRNAAPQAGQNHRSVRGLPIVLFRIVVLYLSGVLRRRYERAIACAAETASAVCLPWLRAQATVCRIASRSGVASSLKAAA